MLRFDFTGLGESEGDFADTDFSSNLEDLVAAEEGHWDQFDQQSEHDGPETPEQANGQG